MKPFNEFRMLPMTMARDNAIIGNEVEEGPYIATDSTIEKSILSKIEKDLNDFRQKKPERYELLLKQLAKAAGYGLTKQKQVKGKTYRYDLKR